MENLFKINRYLLVLPGFLLVFQLALPQQEFIVHRVKGEPYLEVNDSIKSVTKGSILNANTFLKMNRDDVVNFVDENGDMFQLIKTGTYSYKDLKEIPAVENNSSFLRNSLSYLWKEFTNTMPARNNKSGVVYRGDEIIQILYPKDSSSIIGNEVRFAWKPIKNKEKDYYFMLRDIETGLITTIGTPSTSVSITVDNNLLILGKQYEWTVTETKYPDSNIPFYHFNLLTEKEIKDKQKEIKQIMSFLKQQGYNSIEIREVIFQDFKICY